MKFFHLSDLHIGLRLYNRDLYEDQLYIFRSIAEAAAREKPDAVIIAGDIYHKAVPSAEAIDLFDRLISMLTEAVPGAEIMMISGNHDSGPRVNIYRSILQRQHIHMIGLPPQQPEEHIEKVTLGDEFGPVSFFLLPFVRPSMVRAITGFRDDGSSLSYSDALRALINREYIDTSLRNVLVSHQFYIPSGADPEIIQRMDSEIPTVGNIDAVDGGILKKFDYAALGHIHKPMTAGSPLYRYCGTPIPCSISEAGQQKGISVVEMQQKGSTNINTIPLAPLRQVRLITGILDDVLHQSSDDYVSVVLTDTNDLDMADTQFRLRRAFPNLLEIRRSGISRPNYSTDYIPGKDMDIFSLCASFLGDLSEDENALLKDVINSVQEAQL